MDKKQLRSIGHHLKPVVTVAGAGLSENVVTEIGRALSDHELIKVRVSIDDRESRADITQKICQQQGAELVQSIGKIILIFKKNTKPNPKTSNIIRFLNAL